MLQLINSAGRAGKCRRWHLTPHQDGIILDSHRAFHGVRFVISFWNWNLNLILKLAYKLRCWHILLLYSIIGSCGNPDAKRLYDDLLSNYNKLVRPVVNVTDAVTVRLKLKLSQLIDVVSDFWNFSKKLGPFWRYLATFCQCYRKN